MPNIDNVTTIEGSLQQGGWRAEGVVFDDADRLTWYQEIDIWYDLYVSAGWEALPRQAIRGHILPDPFDRTFQTSMTQWSAFTAQEFMKHGELQGIFFKAAGAPANEHQITSMTYADIVEHIVGKSGQFGHCNLVDTVWPEGFLLTNIDTTNSAAPGTHEVKEGNFWARLKEIAEIETYLLYVDKTNTLNYIPHPMFAATLPAIVFDIDSSWLMEPLTVANRNTEAVGQCRVQGSTPGGLQISGKYPTEPTAGPILQKWGFKADDNSKMNTIAERIYKYNNRDISVTAKLQGAVGLMIDIMDRVSITYTSTTDGVSWSAKPFWVEGIRVDLKDPFNAITTLKLEAENA